MELTVRKVVQVVEEVRREQGRVLPTPLRIAVVAAVIDNPYGPGWTEDVVPLADALGPVLGALVGPPCVALLDRPVEAYGKAAVVGIDGELEHGSALIHNLRFGNAFREAAGGTELLPAAEKVALPGAAVDIPIKHLRDARTRSHHQTVTVSVPDAPRPREILVACVAADGGRPLARLAPFGAEVT